MGMPVMKEAGAMWLTALYDKLIHEKSIVINGFKKVGIVEVVRKTREGLLSDEDEPTPNDNCCNDPFDDPCDDPFDSSTEPAD